MKTNMLLRSWRKKDSSAPSPPSLPKQISAPPSTSSSADTSFFAASSSQSRTAPAPPTGSRPGLGHSYSYDRVADFYPDGGSFCHSPPGYQHSPPRTPPRTPHYVSSSSIHRSPPLTVPVSPLTIRPTPARPPRPPGNLYDSPQAGVDLSIDTPATSLTTSPASSLSTRVKRAIPQLDGVWSGFLRDTEEDMLSLAPTPELVRPSQQHRRPNLSDDKLPAHRHQGSAGQASHTYAKLGCNPAMTKSTPHLRLQEDSDNDSVSSYQTDATDPEPLRLLSDALSQFPLPPTLIRKHIPPPLIFKSTVALQQLPPSPLVSSCDSTPLATPTSDFPHRGHFSPSFHKKSSMGFRPPLVLDASQSTLPAIPIDRYGQRSLPLPPPPPPKEPHRQLNHHRSMANISTSHVTHKPCSSDSLTSESTRWPQYTKYVPASPKPEVAQTRRAVQWGYAI